MALPRGWRSLDDRDYGGGQSFVYRAQRAEGPDTSVIYALKVLANPHRRARFAREVNTMMLLVNAGVACIPPVAAYDLDAERPWFATPWYPSTFAAIVEGGNRLAVEDGIARLINVAEALAEVHAHGVAHRDIKPANVLADGEGRVFLGDFGLCLGVEDDRTTDVEEAVGSRLYIAPENSSGMNDANDQRPADLYAFGKLTWGVLAGRRPFDREDHRVDPWRLATITGDTRLDQLNGLLDQLLDPDPRSRLNDWPTVIRELATTVTSRDARAPWDLVEDWNAVLEKARQFRAVEQATDARHEAERQQRVERWLSDTVVGAMTRGARTRDAHVRQLQEAIGNEANIAIVGQNPVPDLAPMLGALGFPVSVPVSEGVAHCIAGVPHFRFVVASRRVSLEVLCYTAVIRDALWLVALPALQRPLSTSNFRDQVRVIQPADGEWPGTMYAQSRGPHPLFMDSTVDEAATFGAGAADVFLRIAGVFIDLLHAGVDPALAQSWEALRSQATF